MTHDTTPETDAISAMQWEGNILHSHWYKTITILARKEKPDDEDIYIADTIAILILSEIVFWYRNTEVRDEKTLKPIAYKKRFAADLLQLSYGAIANRMGITKRAAEDAIKRLEKEHGVIRRVFRTITTDDDRKIPNVLFIQPVLSRLIEVSHPAPHIRRYSAAPSGATAPHSPALQRRTNTESTSTQNTNTEKEGIALSTDSDTAPASPPSCTQGKDGKSGKSGAKAKPAKEPVPEIIANFRQVTSLYPDKKVWGMVMERLTGVPLEKIDAAYTMWVSRGYNKVNIDWTLWARDGIPEPKFTARSPKLTNDTFAKIRQEELDARHNRHDNRRIATAQHQLPGVDARPYRGTERSDLADISAHVDRYSPLGAAEDGADPYPDAEVFSED